MILISDSASPASITATEEQETANPTTIPNFSYYLTSKKGIFFSLQSIGINVELFL
jgi:hypothetical protein